MLMGGDGSDPQGKGRHGRLGRGKTSQRSWVGKTRLVDFGGSQELMMMINWLAFRACAQSFRKGYQPEWAQGEGYVLVCR